MESAPKFEAVCPCAFENCDPGRRQKWKALQDQNGREQIDGEYPIDVGPEQHNGAAEEQTPQHRLRRRWEVDRRLDRQGALRRPIELAPSVDNRSCRRARNGPLDRHEYEQRRDPLPQWPGVSQLVCKQEVQQRYETRPPRPALGASCQCPQRFSSWAEISM